MAAFHVHAVGSVFVNLVQPAPLEETLEEKAAARLGSGIKQPTTNDG